jgi:hypothetical protein
MGSAGLPQYIYSYCTAIVGLAHGKKYDQVPVITRSSPAVLEAQINHHSYRTSSFGDIQDRIDQVHHVQRGAGGPPSAGKQGWSTELGNTAAGCDQLTVMKYKYTLATLCPDFHRGVVAVSR